MMGHAERTARRGYRILLRAFPRAYRERNGEEMEDAFMTLLRWGGDRKGFPGKVNAWLGGAWDAVANGVTQRLALDPGHSGRREPGRGPTRRTGVREMLGTVWGDVHFAIRGLIRRPLFSAAVILTLAVGIGANTSVFTLVDGLLLTPLPYEDPGELVTLWEENPVRGWSKVNVSPLNASDWRERSRALEDLALFYSQELSLTGEGPPALLSCVRVSPNLFGLLGTGPALGRGFSEEEMGIGRDGVVILTDGFWKRHFGEDRTLLGRTIDVDGAPRVVVGILPPDFRFMDEEPDVFLPLDLIPTDHARDEHFLKGIGRLASGVGIDEARTELGEIALQLEEEYPESNENWRVQLLSAHEDMLGETAEPAALILMAAVGFVLLMVCVNVANLALARGEHRARELAIRTAMGAGRGRFVRQLLTESLVLGTLGGGFGLLLANWGYRGIVATLPSHTAPIFQFGLDGSVLLFTSAITLASVLLFGIVPALRLSRSGVGALRDGGRSGLSAGSARFGNVLVVLQTAIALVLLVGGGLLMKSISEMRNQDLGFDPENALTVRISPPAAEYPGDAEVQAFWEAVEGRVAETPGVAAVGTTQSHPLMGATWVRTIRLVGQDQERTARLTYASGGLFDALGFRTVRGRPLGSTDDETSPEVAVVNEAFVGAYLGPDVDPLRASLQGESGTLPPVPIVGVINDAVEGYVHEAPGPALYLSFAQAAVRRRSLVVRISGPPQESIAAIKEAVWSVDPKLPLDQIEMLQAQVDRHVGGFAVVANLMGVFALLSLLLGALGIYGVTAYSVGRRTSEIGIRMAMGAEPGAVVRMVVGQGFHRTLLGLALGLVLAFPVTGAMGSLLMGVSPRDPVTFVVVPVILATVSLLALWIPARQVAAVDPLAAIGKE